ncbi:hypothetical protein [Eisenbergiella tayi]|uniref:CopG family transcriptional regulator n=1 Tax=Eisenbergiella tayi TaxID=1432052 RepID=A0A1E3A334_9FIRM|nr:hypothetical protein [Eisenbergiella tayi]ODM03174.1 hypothetical protein BEI61_03968 [Eisenbergiella tayi]
MDTRRMSVTILPEWEHDLDNLKREKFYDKPRSEMIRFLIQLGLEKSKQKTPDDREQECRGRK